MFKNLRNLFSFDLVDLIIILNCIFISACSEAKASNEMSEYERNPTGWSQSGNLRTRTPMSGVPLQAQFSELTNYTVQFNIDAVDIPGVVGRRTEARAEIIWSVRGNSIRRLISVSDGTALTGTGEAINVRLFDNTQVAPVGGDFNYRGSIQVTKGTRGSNKQPPFLDIGRTVIATGTSTTITLPNDVGANSLLVVVGPDSPVTIPDGHVLVQIAGITRYDPRDYDWVPLDPGASQVTFSTSATAPDDISFHAYLGIDG